MGKRIAIVGAGPVGSLAALYAASRGNEVEVYELRGDLRDTDTTPLNFTKSINLALSERGINGIRQSGHADLLDQVLAETIPMHGRMVHTRSGTGALKSNDQAYDPVRGRFQRSVDRGGLNKCLLQELGKLPNVKLMFNHKLTGADFRRKKAWFEHVSKDPSQRAPEVEVQFDLLIGADGAHSAVRHHMMKFARMDFSQTYIDCLWCEFSIPPSSSNDFRISPNHLHIWPAGNSMFIALPNLDKSFVCTLFGPVSLFERLGKSGGTELLSTFDSHFPGIVPDLITKDALQAQFNRNPHLPLINIKCSPHHYKDSAVILGDAANAIVPFYGQGMNAGLESVRILFEKLDAFPSNTADALAAFTQERVADTHTIADLALENYWEMRAGVTSRTYKARKWVEETLDKYIPSLGWATQYSRVSFTNLRYSDVRRKAKWQKQVLMVLFWLSLGVGSGGVVSWLVRFWRMRGVKGGTLMDGGLRRRVVQRLRARLAALRLTS